MGEVGAEEVGRRGLGERKGKRRAVEGGSTGVVRVGSGDEHGGGSNGPGDVDDPVGEEPRVSREPREREGEVSWRVWVGLD